MYLGCATPQIVCLGADCFQPQSHALTMLWLAYPVREETTNQPSFHLSALSLVFPTFLLSSSSLSI